MKVKMPSNREAAILNILINGEKYGREIRNDYERLTGRKLPLGSLYTTLSRMELARFVNSQMGESTNARGGYKRKYFSITGLGRQALGEYQLFVANLFAGALSNV